ncbi:aldo/keto reductase [Reinekea marina]|uniref:Aldo/keto reductase family oxidoreductase n=1 Tax=Reinekea marina TaxID=1310421 RepID=A0ABV7WRG2_9GAMM|nr:aldo/keto reductase [Reinekea marina]MDN3647598.1 aldo/keto reductase [Reinekea marina]
MNRVMLPNSDFSLSQLVYGVWRIADDSDTSAKHVRAKIELALEQGMTTFDHADIYGNYECERLFGQVLAEDKSLREQMEIITKCDICLDTDKFPARRVKYYDTSPNYIQSSVEQSLKLLHSDTIETLLIHRPDPFMDAEATGRTLDNLIESGKVRSVGVSNFKPEDWRWLQKNMHHKLVLNQIELSVMENSALKNGDLSALQNDNMATMAWSPLAGGRLFGDEAAAQRVMPVLARIAQEQNSRVDLVAIAWLLAHPANIIPVVGTNNLKRLNGVAGALEVELDRETWFEIMVAADGHEVP